MNCEIVDGGAFATIYKYCRTHKCEPKDCPNNIENSWTQLLLQFPELPGLSEINTITLKQVCKNGYPQPTYFTWNGEAVTPAEYYDKLYGVTP